ncbi:HTH-type transcriptional regulator PuuR [Pelagimonas phthalicica]|uniref:HTH-type transcriptional regulator PuuR n=1 Tax=Pelagimonas phthalicica TaxID=1037362 RepID=A0A238JFD4_9RHOB|nr:MULTISPECIES: helix-turn-helix transcriptional regulator [Roseobacteraceae]MBO9466109.1 helix-turn-helix domain-containing protein [Tropicibacter sp. R15_0]TDS91874.1 transcriptional regulator with XRE-family HTH domain [Pelagimonas phthalicica]SMX28924.1 HTH-type transcriptional regulator PuuR [Pelagimonas phthalicica]
MKSDLTVRLADRLSRLRADKGWTLDQLAGASGVSRAALSRLENAEVSPSADVLDKLASAHSMSLSRLLAMTEAAFPAHIQRDDQAIWRDSETGFARRIMSPGAAALAGEVEECRLPPGSEVVQDGADIEGQEVHILILSGYMHADQGGQAYSLAPGDALRFRQSGALRLVTAKGQGCKFMICRLSG